MHVPVKCVILRLGDLTGKGENFQYQVCIPWAVFCLDVVVGIGEKAISHIEILPAAGEGICGNLDFQQNGLFLHFQKGQRLRPIAQIALLGANCKVL